MSWTNQVPFLRVLFPFLSGILLALELNQNSPHLILIFAGCFLALYFYRLAVKRKVSKHILIVLSDICLFTYGMLLVQNSTLCWKKSFYGNLVKAGEPVQFVAEIEDIPAKKLKTYKLHLRVREVRQGQIQCRAEGKLIAYVKKQRLAEQLKAGQGIYFQTLLQEVEPASNPGGFNYQSYLYNRQIYHVVFLDSGAFRLLETESKLSRIRLLALQCKQWIVTRLKSSGLSEDAASVCTALLCGYDADLGQDVLQAFAHSGTLHVLSVSGLHTGLIYAFLSFCFDLFDKQRRFKILKFSVISVLLWLFALLTGLSAPVLRAVLMLSLFGIGTAFFRNDRGNQLNLLFVSAFILLGIQPYFIRDIGFQLSFTAIFGLIYFQPALVSVFTPKNKPTQIIWTNVCSSFAATISTLPITLYYFKQFPFWFFVANLVVVPATFLLLVLAVPALFHLTWLSCFLSLVVELLIRFIGMFNSEPYGYIDRINFTEQDLIWIVLLIVFVSLAITTRLFKHLRFVFMVLIAWQVTIIYKMYRLRREVVFTVYDLRGDFAYSLKSGPLFYLYQSDSTQYERQVKPHLISLGNPEMKKGSFNNIGLGSLQFLILNRKNYWPEFLPGKVVGIVLSSNFRLCESDFRAFQKLRVLVCDRSNSAKTLREMEELCRKFGVLFYSTRSMGAFQYKHHEDQDR